MIRFSCLFVLVGVFQVITSQGPPRPPYGRGPPDGFPENIPEKCRGPPEGVVNPAQCCQLSPLYTEEDLAACGVQKNGEQEFRERRGPPDCSKAICLMKRNDMLDEDDNIDFPAVGAFLDKWAGNGNFQAPVQIAKVVCTKKGSVPGPPHVCEPIRLAHCVGGVLFGECPKEHWLPTENCQILRNHMEECKATFPRID